MTGGYSRSYYDQTIEHTSQPLKWLLTMPNPNFVHSDEHLTLGLLLNSTPNKQLANQGIMTNAMTRTLFKQQLQRQQLEQEEKFSTQTQNIVVSESQSIEVPRNPSPTTVPSDVPSSVLKVSYFVVRSLPKASLAWHGLPHVYFPLGVQHCFSWTCDQTSFIFKFFIFTHWATQYTVHVLSLSYMLLQQIIATFMLPQILIVLAVFSLILDLSSFNLFLNLPLNLLKSGLLLS